MSSRVQFRTRRDFRRRPFNQAGWPTEATASNGNDIVVGGAGNDALLDSPGDDNYFGGEGNDTLKGGNGLSDPVGGGIGDGGAGTIDRCDNNIDVKSNCELVF